MAARFFGARYDNDPLPREWTRTGLDCGLDPRGPGAISWLGGISAGGRAEPAVVWNSDFGIRGARFLVATPRPGHLRDAGVGYNVGAFMMHDPDVAGIHSTPGGFATMMVGLLAMRLVVGGGIGQLVAWIDALVATARGGFLTWFLVLLVFGLLATAFVPMIAYVLAGPDAARSPAG